MIRAIMTKELLEHRRDGRLRGVLGLMLVLAAGGLLTAWPTYLSQQQAAAEGRTRDQEAFLQQGDKAPHAAAHFGRMAYKPAPPLAVFDAGATPYLGQVIWLEAHRQDPAMFRPAEDSPELRRVADLSAAGVITLLVPLILCVIGSGVYAGERERGSLRQVMSMSVRPAALFMGKLAALAGVGVAISTVVICAALAIALLSSSTARLYDILVRAVWLIVTYAAYNAAFAAVVLAISARTRSTAAALMLSLGVWAGSVVLAPRFAASVAEQVHPTPDAGAFWADASAGVRARQPERSSPAYRALQREVLSRALGRDIDEAELAELDVNRFGLSLEVSELLGAKAYAEAYDGLYETYGDQQRIRRLLALVSPTITLQHASRALAGTDIAAHRQFALAAETHRTLIIRMMNEDLMLKGAGQGFDYRASAEFWGGVPDFRYEALPASFALRAAAVDLVILFAWTAAALGAAYRFSVRQRAI